MHTRLDPVLEEDIIEAVARAHYDIGAGNGLFRLDGGRDLDAELGAHLLGEGLAVVSIRTEAADRLDRAHGADRHQLRACLPAGAEDADGPRILAREIFCAEAVGGAHAHALHDAVGKDRKRPV